ncbi:MAG: hypothetical protein U1E17_06560 [Geminicoccaceae bacterium]
MPVDQGHVQAQAAMRAVIEQDVRADIGGDQQMIQHLDTEHREETFKQVLLPVWVAAFQFLGRPYRFVVNGRTGEVRAGRAAWSAWKIARCCAPRARAPAAAGAPVRPGPAPAGPAGLTLPLPPGTARLTVRR